MVAQAGISTPGKRSPTNLRPLCLRSRARVQHCHIRLSPRPSSQMRLQWRIDSNSTQLFLFWVQRSRKEMVRWSDHHITINQFDSGIVKFKGEIVACCFRQHRSEIIAITHLAPINGGTKGVMTATAYPVDKIDNVIAVNPFVGMIMTAENNVHAPLCKGPLKYFMRPVVLTRRVWRMVKVDQVPDCFRCC